MTKKWRYYLGFLGLLLLGLSVNFLLPLGFLPIPDFGLNDKWERVEQAFIDKSMDVVLDKSEPYPFAPVLAYNHYYYERLSDPSLSFPEDLFLSEALIKGIKKNLLDEPYKVMEVNFNFRMMKIYSDHVRVALTKTFTLKKMGKANGAEYYRLSLNEAYLVEKVGDVWKLSNVINDVHPFF